MKNLHAITLLASLSVAAVSWTSQAHAEPEPTKDQRPSETPTEAPEHVRIGALAGVGFPRPLAFEAMVKLEKIVAIGAEYSFLPKTTIAGVDTTFYAIAADARVFPFKNAFFIGLRAGRQHLGATTTLSGTVQGVTLSANEAVTIDTWFVNPRIGFLWTFDPGITLGIDAGVQLPVSVTSSSTLPTQLAAASQIESTANAFGRSPLPTIDLLRVGFLY